MLNAARWITPLALVLVGCSQPASGSREIGSPSEPSGRIAHKTLTIAYEAEPLNLAYQAAGASGSRGGTDLRLAVHQRLAGYDARGVETPLLASELPSTAKGTWTVRPDGSMQTIYRLRPNVTWHDGTPLTGKDFVFAREVVLDPEIPTAQGGIARQIDRIEVPDNLTLVIEWRETHPFANVITEDDLGPLPAHLLESTFRADKDRFSRSTYWKEGFIGVGPYQLAGWETDSHLTLRAYDNFYLGRAKIDTVIVRFMGNSSAVMAGMLAGVIDGEIPRALDFIQANFVKQEWEKAGKKPLFIVQPTNWRFMAVQFRPETARPTDILDARVRRGLLLGLDRQALVDALLEGQALISDAMITPDELKWEWVKDAVTTYSYDTRRAQEGLAEAGWRRSADGTLANARGERPTTHIWSGSADQDSREAAIIGDYWKALGVDVELYSIPAAQERDQKLRASFPGFYPTGISLTFANLMGRIYGPACPTEATRWVGGSVGCYQNAEMDLMVDALKIAVDSGEQQRLWRDLMRLQTSELPVLPLYFNPTITIFRDGVTGVSGNTRPSTSFTWNIAQWDIE